jgi:hypothetical protein
MVVRISITTGQTAPRNYRSLLRASIIFAVIALQPNPAQSASSSSSGSPNPFSLKGSAVSPRALSQGQVFDPAAAQLSSFWSYGAMSIIAPFIFGDFVSPIALSSQFGLNAVAPMPLVQGSDNQVASVLDTALQPAILPTQGAQFDINSDGTIVASGGDVIGWNVAAVGLNNAIPTLPTVGAVGTIQLATTASGIQPICSDDRLEKQLQVGGQFWNNQAVSGTPVQFRPGLFTGPVVERNPLGGLGPRGNPTNLPRPGPTGSWCRPGPAPFSESSPLEDRVLWIGVGLLLLGVLVFCLSRGMRMPTRSFGRSSSSVVRGDGIANGS